jgi:OmcA/MtrC family decaheme c-type cytochrome
MHKRQLLALAAVTAALAWWGTTTMRGQAAAPAFEYQILGVQNTRPGEFPTVTFQVVQPGTNIPYNLKTDLAWTQTASGASRLFVQVGWDTRDYTNTGSGSERAAVGGAPALPIAINALTASTETGGLVYTVTSKVPIPATARGTGTAALEGHPAGQDAAGAWTVRVPVKSAYFYFPITDATSVARREVVDVDKCKACHGSVAPRLSLHGNNRTEEIRVCVMCHNPNATDIAFRLATDGPEVPLDFKRMIHSIHAAKMRSTPFVVIGFQHSVNDFSTVDFPGELADCQACHRSGTYGLPLSRNVLGTTVDTRSTFTETTPGTFTKTLDADPANDLNITPIAAVCSACHDGREALDHMRSKGASFSALQADITSGRVRERCPACHGAGREKDVVRVHAEEAHESLSLSWSRDYGTGRY